VKSNHPAQKLGELTLISFNRKVI